MFLTPPGSPIVSAECLAARIDHPDLVILPHKWWAKLRSKHGRLGEEP